MKPVFGWYIKHRIILHRGFGDQTLADIQNINDHLIRMLDKGKPPVHIVIDARKYGLVPTGLLDMSKATTFLNHPAVGWVITVADSSIIHFLAGILPEMSSVQHFRVLTKLDEALMLLKEQEPSLDWSTANDKLVQ